MKLWKKISRKGQAEIIGLVIIVIMLSLGFLFLAQFAVQEQPEKTVFTRKGLAYSSMSAVLKTTLECDMTSRVEYLSVGDDLFEDCAKNRCVPGLPCGASNFMCSDMHSCEYLEQEVGLMLDESLGLWNKEYEFRSTLVSGTDEYELFLIQEGDCGGERDSSGLFPTYITGLGLVQNTLYLCN